MEATPIANRRRLRVLIVEDNPGDARLLEEMLAGDVPFDLKCVERLSEAIEVLDKERIDAVLLDLSLPDSQGLDTFIRTNAHSPEVAIIVLTGLDDQEVAIRAMQKGAQDYLVKGHVDSDSLTRAMRYGIERKRLEAQLGEFHGSQAEERLTDGLNHQFKNIITGILLNVQTARMDASDEIQRSLEIAEGASHRVAEMVQQLVLFSQRKTVNKQPIDIAALVGEVVEICRSTFDANVTIRFERPAESIWIDGDQEKLKQVFHSLFINARDALREVPDPNRELGLTIKPEQTEDGDCQISVSDNGIGMDEDTRKQMFEPFFTTKPNDEGMGLGLAISAEVIERHDGRTEVQSRDGEGTTFKVFIPLMG